MMMWLNILPMGRHSSCYNINHKMIEPVHQVEVNNSYKTTENIIHSDRLCMVIYRLAFSLYFYFFVSLNGLILQMTSVTVVKVYSDSIRSF